MTDKWVHVEKTEHHGHYIEDAVTGRTICDLYYKHRGDEIIDHDNAEEHAKLIKAAPLLMEALENLVMLIEHPSNDHDETLLEIVMARAAIAEATGADHDQ